MKYSVEENYSKKTSDKRYFYRPDGTEMLSNNATTLQIRYLHENLF